MDFLNWARTIVDVASSKGVTLRALGAVAIRLHCSNPNLDADSRPLSDLDFITYSKHAGNLEPVFVSLGFVPNVRFHAFYGRTRRIYDHKDYALHVDVFLDNLEFCHTISFRDRLELDYPTVTVSDLLLQKLQIVSITEKDFKDIALLLHSHDVASREEDSHDKVDAEYVAKLLSQDWGFYYTATTNLEKTKNFVRVNDVYDQLVILRGLETLRNRIENEPKSLRWALRARVGTSKIWYHEVDEVRR